MLRSLQVFVALLGTVALVAGLLGVLFGAALIPGDNTAGANVDSELRFFAAWYAAAGGVLLAQVRGVATATLPLRLVAGAFGLAAVGRVLSWATVGRPHGWFVMLLVVEIVIALGLPPWQASVARRTAA